MRSFPHLVSATHCGSTVIHIISIRWEKCKGFVSHDQSGASNRVGGKSKVRLEGRTWADKSVSDFCSP
jgi:hypothetical protein